jgi:dTDP-4-dehydrorhamnose reductase
MKILVTGSRGQVALSLMERGAAAGIDVVAAGRPELDLTDTTSIAASLQRASPDVVVNAAAYTAVDKAEAEPELAMRVNGEGAAAVARVSAAMGLPIIQLSTDYVFDGTSPHAYEEQDPTAPASAYGRSKLAGERAVAAENPRHAILRTAWVYSPFGHNFVKTMLRLGENRNEVAVVADQRGAPTYAIDIADAILAIAGALRTGDGARTGIFHVTGTGEATWAEFAQDIFDLATEHGRPRVRVRPITTADYPTAAKRPANSQLSTGKLAHSYGITLPPWRHSLRACIARLFHPTRDQ